MIGFQLEAKDITITGDHMFFDRTEIGKFTKEERKGIKFVISPLLSKEKKQYKKQFTTKEIPEAIINRVKKEGKELNEENELTVKQLLLELNVGVIEKFDEDKYYLEIAVQKLKSWNILDVDGKEIPCNKKNKRTLFEGGYPMLGGAIVVIAQQAISRRKFFEREEEKN